MSHDLLSRLDDLMDRRGAMHVFIGPSALRDRRRFSTIRGNDGQTIATGRGDTSQEALLDALRSLEGDRGATAADAACDAHHKPQHHAGVHQMKCNAYRQTDEMFCPTCGFRWDVDDTDPPQCRRPTPLLRLIGISGPAGSGKSTAAEYLEREMGYQRMRFAAPLKNALRRMLQAAMIESHVIERMIEGDLKEVPHAALMGKTPRHAMQTLGTEWGRHCIGEAYWVNLVRHAIESLPRNTLIVVEDVRFENEAAMIRDLGGKVIRMSGRGVPVGNHPSEAGVRPDITCYNDGSIVELHKWFDYVTRLSQAD